MDENWKETLGQYSGYNYAEFFCYKMYLRNLENKTILPLLDAQ